MPGEGLLDDVPAYGSLGLGSLMPYHQLPGGVTEHLGQDGDCERVLQLTQTVGHLVIQKRRLVTESLGDPVNALLPADVLQGEQGSNSLLKRSVGVYQKITNLLYLISSPPPV